MLHDICDIRVHRLAPLKAFSMVLSWTIVLIDGLVSTSKPLKILLSKEGKFDIYMLTALMCCFFEFLSLRNHVSYDIRVHRLAPLKAFSIVLTEWCPPQNN